MDLLNLEFSSHYISGLFSSRVGFYRENVAKFVSKKPLVKPDGAQKTGAFCSFYSLRVYSPSIRECLPRQQLFR
jgi:hypothetical protein